MSSRELARAFLTFLMDINRANHTIINNRTALRTFLNFIKDTPIELITLDMIVSYVSWLKNQQGRHGNNYSTNTINSKMLVIKSFFAWLDKYVGIKNFDYTLIPIPFQTKNKIVYLTIDEFNRIVSAINTNTFTGTRLRAMLETYMSTGARLSGILGLTLAEIDLNRREAVIRKKGGGYQLVYLNKRSVTWINKYLALRDDDCKYLWISRKCGVHKLKENCLESQIVELKKTVFIGKDWTLHTIRHSFATQLLRNQANIRVIQELLGHKSISSTMIYTNVCNADLKNAHHKFLKI